MATGAKAPFFTDVKVKGTPLRVFTTRWNRNMALQVADQHGAALVIESPPDGGTLVRLRFPAPS